MAKIRLELGPYGWMFRIVNTETGQDILIQTDWDYPGTASAFGWNPCDKCRLTDGTVDCAHHKASEMIVDARRWLHNHIGIEAEDPGYFLTEEVNHGEAKAKP